MSLATLGRSAQVAPAVRFAAAVLIGASLALTACHARAPKTPGNGNQANVGSGGATNAGISVSGTSAGTASSTGGADATGTSSAGRTGLGGASGGASGSSGASAGSGGSSQGAAGSASGAEPEATHCVANAFALNDVSLEKSDFTANRDRTLTYLRAIDADSLLYNFRTTVGLGTNNASPPSGWDAPSSNLRGHTTGHVLKALAQAYAGTGDAQYKTKADYLVSELKKVQDLAGSKGFGEGYLSAYPPDQFVKLESLATYPTIWAPYYTLHKILAGLLASYQITANATALDMAQKIAVWVNGRLSKLPRTQLQSMWNLYIAGEYGGMNEVLAELYDISGDHKFLDTAVLFDKDLVLDSCAANQDKLGGLHANQHIPTITGYLRIYDGNGTAKYLSAAQNFWSMVTTSHMYIIGGTGEAEMWKPAGQIASAMTEKTCETCATYNMLKLTRQLFCHEPDAKYMDYYERGLYNHILGSQDPSASQGPVTYFVPLSPGARRSYNTAFTCCHGTGMENHTKYQEQIYSYSADGSMLYVNLYIASTLHWDKKGFSIAQATSYPYEPSSRLTVTGVGPLKIAVRVPSWATAGFTIAVNGTAQNVPTAPGTYAVVDRTWASGDVLDVSMPFTFRIERTPDDSTLGGILYGPSILVANSTQTTTITLSLDPKNPAAAFTPMTAPLTFGSNGLTFEPFHKATNIQYHTYFKL